MSRLKREFSRIDPGLLVAFSICLLAIWPFISRSSLPQATDAELHVFRLAELSRLVRAGEIYPRWAPNFYFGFGYPIFNYYAPLAYYIGLVVDLMPLLSPVDGVKAVFILGLLIAGLGMYGFVRDNWGRGAGLVAAAVYVYAPYIQFVDPHARGDLAEAFSFGMFPLTLWGLDRLRRAPSPLNWFVAAVLVGALILSHNLMAMVFYGILVAWAIWQLASGRVELAWAGRSRSIKLTLRFRLFLALFLGALLAAFFWLPVALEQDAVNLGRLVSEGGHFDFRNHFLTWGELLAPPNLLDWGATEPDFALNLGLAQWLLGGIGVVSLVLLGRWMKERSQAVFFAVALAGLIFLMLPESDFIWDRTPLLPFLQFPWRLLGPVAAMLAVLSGAGTATLQAMLPVRTRGWLAAVLVGVVIALALPLSQVPPWPEDFGPTTALRVFELEFSGRWVGTTSTADFVPETVDVLPQPEKRLMRDFFNGKPLDRVNRSTLPEKTSVDSELVTPLHMRFHVSGPADFLLRLHLFDFPGWKARVDGIEVETLLGRPEGFVIVPVSAGDHVVDVEFASTPARRLASAASVLSLILIALITWLLASVYQPYADGDNGRWPNRVSSGSLLLPAMLTAVLITAAQIFLLEPQGWLRYDSSGFKAIPAEHHTIVNFGDQIVLLGYDAPNEPVSPVDNIWVNAYWKAQHPLDINYQVFVHVLDDYGKLVAQSDKLNPGEYPTRRWPQDKYVRDEHRLELPADLPAGEYQLSLGLWAAQDGWRLPLLDEYGNQLADNYVLPRPLVVK